MRYVYVHVCGLCELIGASAARGPTDGEQRGAMPPALQDRGRRRCEAIIKLIYLICQNRTQKSELIQDRTERNIGTLLVRRATVVVAQCRAEPQTKKQQQILSFAIAHFSRYVTVSGHAQDIWVPPATCRK